MRLVPIPQDSFSGSGLTFAHASGSNVATFTYPAVKEGVPAVVVEVRTDGTNLRFFPERSSAQRYVLAKLGLM